MSTSTNHSAHFVQMPLGLWEVTVRSKCRTCDLYEELRPKLNKSHNRAQIIRKLDRLAQKRKDYEIQTDEGLWIAHPAGATETGFYLWNLIFRPSAQALA